MALGRPAIDFLLAQQPPRQADMAAAQAMLNVYLPKKIRIVMVILVLFIAAAVCMTLALLANRGRYAGEWRMLSEPTVVAQGVILDCEARKGSKGSITYIYDFAFTPQQASRHKPVKGYCFSTDAIAGKGAAVAVEYLASDPAVARISGARLNPVSLPFMALLPLNFFLIICFMAGTVVYRKKWIGRLLREGVVVAAALQEIKKGPKNSRTIILGFELDGQNRTAKMQLGPGTKHLDMIAARHESGEKVAALVHPVKKKHVFILDLLMDDEQTGSRADQGRP